MNDLMSLGIHRCWKETFVNELGILQPQRQAALSPEGNSSESDIAPVRFLDVAGGTGDIAFRIYEKQRTHKLFSG
jgi:ubiquinone/menaquinone biosynthesis C-methylase UbiE